MLNSIAITGRLTKDPDLKTTQSGSSVCLFSIACERDAKNAEGQRDTDFIDCVAWKDTAEIVHKTFKKGDGVSVIGRLQTRSYETHDGKRAKAVEIKAERVYFQLNRPTIVQPTGEDEELPF